MLLFYLFLVLSQTLQHLIFLAGFYSEHYSEDSYLYENEIVDLMDLRQVRFHVQRGWRELNVIRGCPVF